VAPATVREHYFLLEDTLVGVQLQRLLEPGIRARPVAIEMRPDDRQRRVPIVPRAGRGRRWLVPAAAWRQSGPAEDLCQVVVDMPAMRDRHHPDPSP
jgi:hypothetical protein